MKTPTTLIIMDGYGMAPKSDGNAIENAATPVLDKLFAECPNTILEASGEDVGLPAGQIGNSEVGHTNIGAGRVVFQELPRITNSIKTGLFFENRAYVSAFENAEKNGGAVHVFVLMSNGGVHSHTTHVWAMLELAKRRGFDRVWLHCFMDGRDVPPKSGADFMRECAAKCEEYGSGKVATVIGRFYALDRDNRWERVESAYSAIVYGEGLQISDPVEAVLSAYENGVTDEFIIPTVCDKNGTVKDGDSIIFMNFRPDRAREITRTFVDPSFDGFERRGGMRDVFYVCTTQYDETMPNVSVAFPPEEIRGTMGEMISKMGLTQLRIAETEKYAHVTFFFNGGVEKVFEGEDRVLIPSPKEYPTYDLVPEMSAYKVAKEACARIKSGKYDFIVLNFANCDMVGHTGIYDAAVKAVEAVDECVGYVVEATAEMGGTCVVTADHGNADMMIAPDGASPHTAHTTNPVPFIVTGVDVKLRQGRLADIAPTMFELAGLEKPAEMTGKSLIIS